jgi:diguanylate cyclase (GGDEF)-like protein
MKNTFPAYIVSSRFVRFLIKIGSSSPLDPEERRKRISAVSTLLIMIIATFAFSFYHLSRGHYNIVALDGVGFLSALLCLLYIRRQEKAFVIYWLVVVIAVVFSSITTILGRTEISLFYWAFVLPAVSFSVLGDKKGLAFCLFFFLLNIFLMTVPESLLSSKPYSSFVVVRSSIIYLILTFIIYYYESSQQMLIKYIQQEKDKYENASKHDALTGLSNRRDIMEKIEDEQERCLRKGRPFTLIMCDIDHFKRINDNFGHDSGDYVLKMIASLFKDQVRGIDCPSRWGGEEFLIMLVETDLDGGQMVAERIRKRIENTVFKYKYTKIPVTMTFGLSAYRGKEDNIEDCIKRADNALFEGKNQGRNRVIAV